MKVRFKSNSAKLPNTPLLVVFAPEKSKPVLPSGVVLSKVALEDFTGKARQVRSTDATSGPARCVLLVGLGPKKEVTAEGLRRAAALAVKAAESAKVASATLYVDDSVAALAGGAEEVGQALAEGASMGTYRYDLGKSKTTAQSMKGAAIVGNGAALKKGVTRGAVLGEANLYARDLQNLAGNQLTPSMLADKARGIAKRGTKITCKVIDEAGMARLKMGLLLGVSRGSAEPAKLIHLIYKPKGKSKGRVALVGKGLTFDAGGISLKPGARMDEMRYDMSGSAAVLGAFEALTGLDVPYEVHGIIPSSENLPDALATKPGDIHTAMNGTTVEIINTDAEGRLILADALCYTISKVKPDRILDLATLTGAVIMALGHEMSAIYPTSDKLRDDLMAAGKNTGESVWPMPVHPAFKENLEGGPADLRNICTPNMGGGSIAGASFLAQFVGDTEWCHMDIAGTAWGQSARDYTGGSGGTGVGTRLLIEYLSR
ncbi:MAG: leucyl aminopeptidase [Candidatus Paceibacteria bacterium]|jgi:leucyl aminopeptidase